MEGQGERRSERQNRSRSRSPDAGRRSNPTSLLPNSSLPQSDEHSFDNHIEDIVFPFVPENQQAPEEDIEIDNDDEIEDIEADSVDDYDTWRKMRDTYISYLPTEDRQYAEELLRRLEELRVQIDTLIEASQETRNELQLRTEGGRRYIAGEDVLPLDDQNLPAIEEDSEIPIEEIQATHVPPPATEELVDQATEEPVDQQSTEELLRRQQEFQTRIHDLIEARRETGPELLVLIERGRDLYHNIVLPTTRISEHDINDNTIASSCSVCLDDFELAEETSQLQCGHVYHSNCILTWLRVGSNCPICRSRPT